MSLHLVYTLASYARPTHPQEKAEQDRASKTDTASDRIVGVRQRRFDSCGSLVCEPVRLWLSLALAFVFENMLFGRNPD